MGISKTSKFLLDKGAVFQAKLTSNHYHWSPLVRGGVEISFDVIIKLTKGECTKVLLERCDTLLNDVYTVPVTEEVLGWLLVMQEFFERDEVENTAQVTEKRKKTDKTPVRFKDIRSMLGTIPFLPKFSQVPRLIETE